MKTPREFWIKNEKDKPKKVWNYPSDEILIAYPDQELIHVREVISPSADLEEMAKDYRTEMEKKKWDEGVCVGAEMGFKAGYSARDAEISDMQDKIYHLSRAAPEVEYKLGEEIERLRDALLKVKHNGCCIVCAENCPACNAHKALEEK